ncbi:MAG: AsmA family protein [Desulfohalobiaceae bacterium]
MKKTLKIVLIGVLSLIVLVALLLTGVVLFVDPNDFRGQISSQVEKHTGRELAIGNIDLSVFPWLGLELSQVSLSNAPGFGEAPFARVEETEVRVKLLPLLGRELEVKTIRIQDLALNLARNAQGVTNWDDLTAGDQAPAPQPAKDQPSSQTGSPLAVLAVGGLEIRNAAVSWDDRQQERSFVLENLNLSVGAVQPDDPFDVDMSCTIRSREPALEADITMKTRARAATSLDRFTCNDLVLGVTASGGAVPGNRVDLDLSADVDLDMAGESLSVQELQLALYELTLTGNVSGSKILSQPTFQGELDLREFSPKALLQELGQPPLETTDPEALTRLSARAGFAATATSVTLDPLAATLDDTAMQGQAAASQFNKPAISFDISLDAIDVDRYLPPPAETPSSEEVSADPPLGAGIPLPVDALRTLVLDGSLSLGRVTVKNLTATDIAVKATARDGVLTVDPARASLYQGGFKGFARLDVRQDIPRIAIRKSLKSIQAGPLLTDLADKQVLSGTGTVTADLTTAGLTPEEMQKNLDGTLSLKFLDGAVYGINIPKMLRDTVKRVKGQQPDPTEVQRTDFAELSGTATIAKGLVRNNDLLLKSPLLRVTGQGEVDLPPETIDYLITTRVVGTLEGQQGKELSELRGLSVPIRITGTFDQPSFKPDVEAIASQLGLQKGKEIIEERIGEQLEQSPVQPDKLLEGLFGN